ncbi:MAG: NUDIX domain-containing protein [Patescibacteria group bacterium]
MNDKSVISCRAVIIKDEKILMIHRKKDGREYWVFPGGHTEVGETPQQTITREVMEETSLKIIKLSEPVFYINKTFSENECYFKCEVADGEPKLSPSGPEKITENNWYSPEWVSLEVFKSITDVYPNEIKVTVV